LTFKLGDDGALSTVRTEPVAADARADGDGRENAVLKLIAGLLGIGYDALKQREVEAQRRRTRLRLAIAAGIGAVFIGVVVFFLLEQTRDARAARYAAEANGDLALRDYARAEIAAAKSLTYRDDPEIRKLLLRARLGGVAFVARSLTPKSELNVFSGDGRVVATVLPEEPGRPRAVSVAAPATGKELWRIALPYGAGAPDAVAMSLATEGSRQIAIAWPERDGTVFRAAVWNLEPGRPAGAMRELGAGDPAALPGRHSKRIPSMAFNPTKPWIATAGEDGKLCLWDLSQNWPKLIWEQEATHQPDVHGIAFNADGSLLGSAGGDYLANVWNISDMTGLAHDPNAPYKAHAIEPRFTLSGHTDSVWSIAFSPDGKRIATGGYDRTIRIWDIAHRDKDGKEEPLTVGTLSGQEGTIFALAFSADSKLLASGASDGSVDLWDAASSRLLNVFRPNRGIVRSVVATSFENGVQIGTEDAWNVWSVSGSSLVTRLWNGGATVAVLSFDPSGEFLAASGGGDDGRVRVWDHNYRLARVLDPKSPGDYTNGVTFSPDGRWIVAGGSNGVIHLWDRRTANWDKVATDVTLFRHGGAVWGLCFDPTGKWLASSSQSPNVQIKLWNVADWSLRTATKSGELVDSVYALVCDPAGNRIVAGDSRARVVVRDLDLNVVAQTTNVTRGEVNVWSLALTDEPHTILSGNSDGHVYRWIPNDAGWAGSAGAEEKIGTSNEDAKVNPTINSVAFNPRTGWVASGGVGPSVELYEIKNLRKLYSLRGHDGTVWWVTFDPSGSRLGYGGLDGIVRVVDIAKMRALMETSSPGELYGESENTTGLTVDPNGNIVEQVRQ
jgi:WD40 repeat protein